ncbi:MAG: UDP-N-acetylmuramoyl-tripeptide--D-alanyl-D-alanine ligase [Candidatus Riflebacteria bacterium]|nr:UDP-N-acetylmuramoyl-tripeptide--D-alanyl-D-alanine ligase [Candidatus Riflebacteria bacterium]
MGTPAAPRERTVLFTACQAALLTRGRLVQGRAETPIEGFSIDTRTLRAGDAFVALPGQKVDGHGYLGQAAAKGAIAALVTRAVPEAPAGLALIQVEDPVAALQALATDHRGRFELPMLAVTGSNGKTSTRAALEAVLSTGLEICATRGNLNNHLGLPLSLFELREPHRMGVFEVGMNHLGEIALLCRILKPSMGVITNVGPAHLEGLGSLENVARAKGELMEALPPSGELFVNGTCPLSLGIASRFRGTSLTVAPDDPAAFARCESLRVGFHRLSGTVVVPSLDLRVPFDAPLSGRHMVFPLLFATAVAARAGLDAATIERGLARFRPEHGRMEVRQQEGIWVIDDCYNANPASMEAALDFLLSVPVAGRRFAVLGDMLELGPYSGDYHRRMLERCRDASGLEAAFLFGGEFQKATPDGNSGNRVRVLARKEAIAGELAERLVPGDALLVKGSRGVALETVLQALFPVWATGDK